jgi:hypothetical protein
LRIAIAYIIFNHNGIAPGSGQGGGGGLVVGAALPPKTLFITGACADFVLRGAGFSLTAVFRSLASLRLYVYCVISSCVNNDYMSAIRGNGNLPPAFLDDAIIR